MPDILEGGSYSQSFGYFAGEQVPWNYTVTIIPGTASANDYSFTPFSGSSVGGFINVNIGILLDLLQEGPETFTVSVVGTYGNGLPYGFTIPVTILDHLNNRDENVEAAFRIARNSFDPETETDDFFHVAWGEIVRQRQLDSQNTELRDAERYILGTWATASPGEVTLWVAGAPVYEGLKWIADLGGLTFMRSDPDIPTSAPGGLASVWEGVLDGFTGNWMNRASPNEAQHWSGGPQAPLDANLESATLYQRNGETGESSFTFDGVAYTAMNVTDVPAGLSQIFLFDDLGGSFALTSGNDVLMGSAAASVHLGGGNDFAVMSVTSQIWGEAGNDTIMLSDGNDVASGGEGSDYLVGGAGADNLSGDAGDDIIDAGAGDDVLAGGAGNDTLDGGDGADTASYAGASAGVSVNLTKAASQNTGGAGSDKLIGIENLTGSGFADTLTGDNLANVLDGGAGADTMAGGNGNDVYYVDNVGDKAVEASGAGSDRVFASVTFSLAGQYTEALTLTGTAAINGTGNTQNNTITGNSAANVLVGGAGDDRLDGGAGADTMRGGLGADTFVIDQAGDIAQENAGEGTDTVEAWISYSLAGQNIEYLKLMGTADLNGTGNSLANTLTGNSGNNVLNGGGGADNMYGGAGDDRFVVDNVGDKVFEATGEGTDIVESSVTFSLAGQAIENLTLTGAAAINGTGNTLANVLTGNSAINVLNGGTGDDQLHGGLGSDTLTGGAGLDGFWFETALGASNVDDIKDFAAVDDAIYLDRTIFAGISANGELAAGAFYQGAAAHDADDRIVYDKAAGKIWYDADGNGAAAAVLFAQVTANTSLTAADFFAVP